MDDYRCLAYLTLLIFTCSGTRSIEIPEIDIRNGTDRELYVAKDSNATLTCSYSGDTMSLLDYTVVWQFSPLGVGDRVTISKNKRLVDNALGTKYKPILTYLNDSVDVSILVKSVSGSDDGRYICKLLNDEDAEVRNKEITVIVPAPVKQLNFTATKENTNRTKLIQVTGQGDTNVYDKAEMFEEGTYQIYCSVSGSNPEPSVHIFKNDKEIKGKTGSAEDQIDNTRQFSAFVEGIIVIDKNSVGQKVTCKVNVKTQKPVAATFDITDVYSRDPRVQCNSATVVQLNGDHQFKCFVRVDKGPVKCQYVDWRNGDTNKDFTLGTDYQCVEVSDTHLETTLTLKKSEITSETFVVIYNGPDHTSVRTEAQINDNNNGGNRQSSVIAWILCVLTLTIKLVL